MSERCPIHGTDHPVTDACYGESIYGCAWEDCTRHPAKGDDIKRVSAKGKDFVGVCAEHYPLLAARS